MIKESYPHFKKVIEKEKNFNQYLENMMNDDEFTRSIFNKIFVKKSLIRGVKPSFLISCITLK